MAGIYSNWKPSGTPATYQELVAACQGADAEFLVSQLEQQATVESAARAWCRELSQRVADSQAEVEDLHALSPAGVAPVLRSSRCAAVAEWDGGDAIAEFDARVDSLVGRGRDRKAAVHAVISADPALHRAYLVAYNTRHGRAAAVAGL